jgi:hypothetical protein
MIPPDEAVALIMACFACGVGIGVFARIVGNGHH